ncbi:MAG: long-chain fatty acid--CoA ligase [Planctomycetes bacterium]|nr:long-chain fatty acid--CoA ligase [Planctomycetota bacterium]
MTSATTVGDEKNLVHALRVQAERLGHVPAVRWKRFGRYQDLSWSDYYEQVQECAAALVAAGAAVGDRIGLLSENRLEWLLADMGIMAAGGVNVPPHAPLTAKQVQFQLADAGVRWLFVSTREQLDKIRQVRHELPELRKVIVFDRIAAGDEAVSWAGFLQRGRTLLGEQREQLRHREDGLHADSLATIMYTSGTTGNPKGVMLTHGNLLSNARATDAASPRPVDSVLFNWLPFSHIYARTVDHYLSVIAGIPLCLAESVDTVVDNLGDIRPTHMSSVPRFYEKVLTAVQCGDEAETGRRLRNIFGPRIDWLGSGGAPLPVAIAEAFKRAGILLLQGYGLTECAPVISFNRKDSYKLETVGQAIPGVEIAIGPDGEVLTRGSHVMKGYWNNSQATAEAVRDGWLHTGDLGTLDADGFLTITGRKKEVLVLSNGKKVVPNQLECLLIADPCIDQAVVHGEGRNFLSALIVPHWENLARAMKEAGLSGDGVPATLCGREDVRSFIACRIDCALAELSPWEQVRKLVLLPRPFSVEAEELTVSLKMRRNVISERYREELDRLYAS